MRAGQQTCQLPTGAHASSHFLHAHCRGVAARKPDLKGVLRGFKGNAGLSMQWVMFGSSGHVERPPGGPLAHYTRCTGHLSFQMKCMANMYHATHHMMVGNTVHDCTYRCVLLSTCFHEPEMV